MNTPIRPAPRLSVVTVVLNGRAVIEQTVRSVLDQKKADVEYVVIDGGSTDGTLDILRAHEGDLDHLVSEPDRGISDAFNKGIAAARGEAIGILNAGDWYEPGALDAVRDARKLERGFAIYHGDLAFHNEDGSPAFVAQPRLDNMWKYMSLFHPTMFVEREVYRRVGQFSVDCGYAMDAEFLHRAIRAGVEFVYIPRVQAHMRLGGNADRHYWRGFAEFRDSAIRHGVPRIPAYYRYVAATLKRAALQYGWGRALKRFRDRLR